MEIDIIDYTNAQFAQLTDEQILKVEEAQLKKNRLLAGLEEELQREKFRLSKNGTLFSTIWTKLKEKLNAEYEQEVENVRDLLLFYLRFTALFTDEEIENAPYEINYSFTLAERVEAVKNYYLTAYSSSQAEQRAADYKEDVIAQKYLGETYKALYDYFLDLI